MKTIKINFKDTINILNDTWKFDIGNHGSITAIKELKIAPGVITIDSIYYFTFTSMRKFFHNQGVNIII